MFCIVYHHNAFQHPTIPEQSHALPLTHGLAIADAAAFCHSRLILPSSSLLDEIGVSLAWWACDVSWIWSWWNIALSVSGSVSYSYVSLLGSNFFGMVSLCRDMVTWKCVRPYGCASQLLLKISAPPVCPLLCCLTQCHWWYQIRRHWPKNPLHPLVFLRLS